LLHGTYKYTNSLRKQRGFGGNDLRDRPTRNANKETISGGIPTVIDQQSQIITVATACDPFVTSDGSFDVPFDTETAFGVVTAATCIATVAAEDICEQTYLGENGAVACSVLVPLLCTLFESIDGQFDLCKQLLATNRVNAIYRRGLYALENQYLENLQQQTIQSSIAEIDAQNNLTSSSVTQKETKRVALQVVSYQPGAAFFVTKLVDFAPIKIQSLCLTRYSNNALVTVNGVSPYCTSSTGISHQNTSFATIFTLPSSTQSSCLYTTDVETMVLWDGVTGIGQTVVNLCT